MSDDLWVPLWLIFAWVIPYVLLIAGLCGAIYFLHKFF
jgi:hypothetical protein